MEASTVARKRAEGIEVRGPMRPNYDEILAPEALAFVAMLTREFRPRIQEALEKRAQRQVHFAAGVSPAFYDLHPGNWTVAPIPADLIKRTVEITGPVERKMVINALNSGADCFMADFEDSNAPTWDNNVQGQINLRDAVRRRISFDDPASGKAYKLNERIATLIVR